MVKEKKCGKCGNVKVANEFHKNHKRKSGLHPTCKECRRKYVLENKEKDKKRKRDWYLKNRDKTIKRSCERQQKKRVERNLYLKEYYKKNPHIYCWRSLIYRSLKYGVKKGTTFDLLGYSYDNLKKHIESKFTEGMSWDNYGEWHVDHIKPLTMFDADTPLNIVNELNNLQPLWATTREINGVIYEGNLNKGFKY